ncbi:UNVERIFIED_CONTAM: helix-turn-helix transcriptional regulator [Comamonas sp. A-3]|jgi:transcriptional regulator with XRE-family HTH domain|uniref:helix-turn-helix domain-containing protein n=1 Tax=Comamonas testosteroni TaxID=285 RepID=UPI0028D81CF9|nr:MULTISPECIES: helix-turn-helix transcriptional regulator [Comamonas]
MIHTRDSQRVPSVSDLHFRQAVAAEVKARRGLIGISQEELAFRAGVHRTFIAKLEIASTQPSLSITFQLAEALAVSPEDLVKAVRLRVARSTQQ